MRIESEVKLDFNDVLIRPKRSTLTSRSDVNLGRGFEFRHSRRKFEGIPVMAANMDTIGTFEMALALADFQAVVALHKHYSAEEVIDFFEHHGRVLPFVCVSTGITSDDASKLKEILANERANRIFGICIDAANGYTESFVEYVRRTRDEYPEVTIIAGNVVTGEMVEELILSGADIAKVGIGPGSVCTTRNMTGVGYPQLSAIIECADAAHGLDGRIIGDGGCTTPGDIAKAFGGGADFVMLGGMLAGHLESGGEVVDEDGEKKMLFYGMSSDTAMQKYAGGVAEYRASEGKTIKVPFRGNVEDTFKQILGGIRSCCTYVGARNLRELPKRTSFILVAQQTNDVFGKV